MKILGIKEIKKDFCTKCGRALREGEEFCLFCGEPVRDIGAKIADEHRKKKLGTARKAV